VDESPLFCYNGYVMAKHKKSKKVDSSKSFGEALSSSGYKIAFAILFLIVGVLLALGNFGVGGKLPEWLAKDGFQKLLGGVAYILPIFLIFWAFLKLKHEQKLIPKVQFWGVLGIVISMASFLRVVSDKSDELGAHSGSGGGLIGGLFGGGSIQLLSKIPSSILWIIVSVFFLSLTFKIPISFYLDFIKRLFAREPKQSSEAITDLADLKRKAGAETGFKMTAGVPVEHNEQKPLSSMRNTAQKLAPSDNHPALTSVNDPEWIAPDLDILNQKQDKADPGNVEQNAEAIRETFANFNIEVEMESANVGPRVTQYTMKPPSGIKLSKIVALDSNLALDLAAQSIRIEAPIPGKRAVGIEVPNIKAATVTMFSLLSSREWTSMESPLGFVVGKDIAGVPVVGALDKMPHLLVAGQTGSGKSVMINTLLTSLLYRNSPADLKMILVDPKQVEMAPYHDIPHLLTPVITEPEKCISALKWAVAEMERRLKTFAGVSKRNIAEYNLIQTDARMPYIVIVIDELADLMMMAARDVEALIVRLAQKARAAGIHLVLATQRPSVDVITGLIKANVPARIAFTVASQIDSRTIIDQAGAEKLLGRGDLLFNTADMAKPRRVQGSLITDDETIRLCDFLRMQRPPQYNDEIISQPVQLNGKGGVVMEMDSAGNGDDDMWRDAIRVVVEAKKASTSLLQRRLRIGYGRAARLIEQMEEQGIVGAADGSRPRDVLISSIDQAFPEDNSMSVGSVDDFAQEQSNPEDELV
jgi:DNA segregation ATPase FtsK/SpoIIIE, S-DNA-T family